MRLKMAVNGYGMLIVSHVATNFLHKSLFCLCVSCMFSVAVLFFKPFLFECVSTVRVAYKKLFEFPPVDVYFC